MTKKTSATSETVTQAAGQKHVEEERKTEEKKRGRKRRGAKLDLMFCGSAEGLSKHQSTRRKQWTEATAPFSSRSPPDRDKVPLSFSVWLVKE